MRQALGRKGVIPQMGGPGGGQGGFQTMPGSMEPNPYSRGLNDPSAPGNGPGPGLGRPQSPPDSNPGPRYGGYVTGGGGFLPNEPNAPGGMKPPGPTGPPTTAGGPGMPQGMKPGMAPNNPGGGDAWNQWKQKQQGGNLQEFIQGGQGGGQPAGSYPGPIVDGKQTFIQDGRVVGYTDPGGQFVPTGRQQQQNPLGGQWPGQGGGGGFQQVGMMPGIGSAPQGLPTGGQIYY